MKKNKILIARLLKDLNIKKGDDLMIHGDAGIIAQLNLKNKKRFKFFFNEIINFVGKKGTILVPSFTYSFCKTKIYNPKKSKSEVGMFGEEFRKLKISKRTNHPIFSFSIFGKNWKYYKKANIETCFGKNSIFHFFHKVNGKIISFGSLFEQSATFLHYIEESAKVNYRYFKTFEGVLKNNIKKKIKTNYYVRDLKKKNTFIMPKSLSNIIREKTFGRYTVSAISSKKLFNYCCAKLKNNQNYLIRN